MTNLPTNQSATGATGTVDPFTGEPLSYNAQNFINSLPNDIKQEFLYLIYITQNKITIDGSYELLLAQRLRDAQNFRYAQINNIVKSQTDELDEFEKIILAYNDLPKSPNVLEPLRIIRGPINQAFSYMNSYSYEQKHNRYSLYKRVRNHLSFIDADTLKKWDTLLRSSTEDPDFFIRQARDDSQSPGSIFYSNENIDFSKIKSPDNFEDSVGIVIDVFEGGYYNPNMRLGVLYAKSGETMFGIDRLNYQPNSREAQNSKNRFFELIDRDRADSNNGAKWVYNYKVNDRPDVKKSLIKEISTMMEISYKSYIAQYASDKLQELINKDSRLQIHFIYAVWNGPGFFEFYCSEAQKDIDNGVTEIDKIVNNALTARIEGRYNGKTGFLSGPSRTLIMRTGQRMSKLLQAPAFKPVNT